MTRNKNRLRFGWPGRPSRKPSQIQKSKRCGVAAVEVAVCLPVIVLLVFGAIEACSTIFLKQSLHVAAYEAARTASRLRADNSIATDAANDILQSRNVLGFTIQFPTGESADVDRGEPIQVSISAPSGINSPLLGQFVPDRTLTASVVMTRE